jgi:hypothetical protein
MGTEAEQVTIEATISSLRAELAASLQQLLDKHFTLGPVSL